MIPSYFSDSALFWWILLWMPVLFRSPQDHSLSQRFIRRIRQSGYTNAHRLWQRKVAGRLKPRQKNVNGRVQGRLCMSFQLFLWKWNRVASIQSFQQYVRQHPSSTVCKKNSLNLWSPEFFWRYRYSWLPMLGDDSPNILEAKVILISGLSPQGKSYCWRRLFDVVQDFCANRIFQGLRD